MKFILVATIVSISLLLLLKPFLRIFLKLVFGLWINAVVNSCIWSNLMIDCLIVWERVSDSITGLWRRCSRRPCCSSCSWSCSLLCGSPVIIVGRMSLLFLVGIDFDCKEPEELQGEYLWKSRLATSPLAAWSFVVSPQMFPVWFDYVKHVKVRTPF